jgi:MoaA/NifB/PqqE/SkfB family radical SAM enzyme
MARGTPYAMRCGMTSKLRLATRVLSAALDPDRPLVTHLVITRRCNLACGYCQEYDHTSPPVPTEVCKERLDHLARLRSVFVTLTGGESLLHPDADALVAHANDRGMVPFLNTNGYLLNRKWIQRLNDAELYALQISVDNVTPNEVSKKSLKTLRYKLLLLSDLAKFRVRINCVLGSSPPEEAVQVARTAIDLGFDISTSLLRNADGSTVAQTDAARAAYAEIRALGKRAPSYMGDDFTRPLLETGALDWKCRAGARTFHVDEFGLVHLCAPRTGSPAKPIELYTVDDIRRYFAAPKACAATCPVAYAHHASRLDTRRAQDGAAMTFAPALVQIRANH